MSYLNAIKNVNSLTYTENGARTYASTGSALLDLFGTGGAYRNRTDADCLELFTHAFYEDRDYALKCLFYLRDITDGQGERRFFRVCFKWLAEKYPAIATSLLEHVPEFGRWDDLYCVVGTPVEKDMFDFMAKQLVLDAKSKTPSLLAKWLKSENASSNETKALATKTRKAFGMTPRQYRLTLSALRKRINVLERLISSNRWNEVEFDKIPSRAGLIYRNAFARHDAERYRAFINSKETKVKAGTLTPFDIAHQVFDAYYFTDVEEMTLDKYWKNLPDYYNGREENGVCVVDVSGSMCGEPMEAAIAMGAYIAERGKGPFANHFITFSSRPQLVEFEGANICAKFMKARHADWGYNTNLTAVFELLLNAAIKHNTPAEEMPTRLYIFSDMQFDQGLGVYGSRLNTLIENIEKSWNAHGYQLPQIVFWNLRASENGNIPAIGDKFSYVSGRSMNMVSTILGGKTGYELMMEKLNSKRYADIHA